MGTSLRRRCRLSRNALRTITAERFRERAIPHGKLNGQVSAHKAKRPAFRETPSAATVTRAVKTATALSRLDRFYGRYCASRVRPRVSGCRTMHRRTVVRVSFLFLSFFFFFFFPLFPSSHTADTPQRNADNGRSRCGHKLVNLLSDFYLILKDVEKDNDCLVSTVVVGMIVSLM